MIAVQLGCCVLLKRRWLLFHGMPVCHQGSEGELVQGSEISHRCHSSMGLISLLH